jgi:hypothetical protein
VSDKISRHNADTQAEAGILFNELTGNASHVTTFNNITVSNSFTHNVIVANSGGVLANLAISGSTFSNNGSSNNSGTDFLFESDTLGVAGTPTMTLRVDGSTFTGNNAFAGLIPGTGLHVVSNDGTVNAHIGETTGNLFDNLNNGMDLDQSSNAGAAPWQPEFHGQEQHRDEHLRQCHQRVQQRRSCPHAGRHYPEQPSASRGRDLGL